MQENIHAYNDGKIEKTTLINCITKQLRTYLDNQLHLAGRNSEQTDRRTDDERFND